MTKKERIAQILTQLKAWEVLVNELDLQMDAFSALTGAPPDSPMLNVIYRVEDAYTTALADVIGDENGWLWWWHLECDMGRKPRDAAVNYGPVRKIRTLKQLARLIVG